MKSYIKYYADEENDEVIIEDLYIAESERGNRKGYKLIDQAVDFAKSEGITYVSLYAYSQDDSIPQDVLVEYYIDYGFVSDANSDALMTYEV